ncbi:MAG: hypothetical protein AAF583_08745 [Pseudomonadota bacterium]
MAIRPFQRKKTYKKSIRPISPQAHTLPMRTDDPLLPLAIEQIGLVVFSLIGWTGIHLSLRRSVKWKLRRAGTKLKVLEGLVRKLIMVLALDLDLAPVKPRPRQSVTPADAPCEDASQPSDSIDIITFPKVRCPSLSLLPSPMDFSVGTDLSQLPRRTTPVHIMARRFSRRIVALQKVLDAPEVHAKRLARSLDKIRSAGEPKPFLVASSFANGFRPELSLLHVGLTERLRAQLKTWDSS